MARLDLLIINPGGRKQIYQDLANDLTAIEPPIWAAMMATFVRNKGYSVEICDANALGLTPEEMASVAQEANPHLVTILAYGQQPSASTQTMPAVRELADAIKQREPERKILLAGGHVAALPEQTLYHEHCDYVALGEGLNTVRGLIDVLRAVGPVNLDNVPGIGYLDPMLNYRSNRNDPLIKNLDDEIPRLAWDLLPMDKYRCHNWHGWSNHNERQPYASFYTTLSCPFDCHFCMIGSIFKVGSKSGGVAKNGYRMWSPKTVESWICELVTIYGVSNIKIADEMFVLNPSHVNGLCDSLRYSAYGRDLNIWAYSRIDTLKGTITPERLREAGFKWLAFGIESASEKVRDDVDKGYSQDQIYSVLNKVWSAGIHVGANYIFGLPEDTMETMQETLDLAMDLNAEWGNFYSAMCYPGSKLYSEAIAKGWELPKSWSGYSQHSVDTQPLPTKYLTAKQVLEFRDNAFQKYFTNPKYLEMIRLKFGDSTVDEVEKMLEYRLERNLLNVKS